MDVDIMLLKKVFRYVEVTGMTSDVAHGGLGGFLHHIAERPRQDKLAFAFHLGCFYEYDFPARVRPCQTGRHTPSDIPTLEDQEKRYIQWVLEKNGGNKTKAAKIMGIDRVSLWRKLKRYGIE